MNNICDYGCGQEAKYKFKNGKECCSDTYLRCPEHINKKREKIKLSTLNYYENETEEQKKNRIECHTKFWNEETIEICKQKANIYNQKNKRTIDKIKKKFPTFFRMEEMRYDPDKPDEKEIQVHCKYHECPNSKEKGGWFTPTSREIERRIESLEHGIGGRNFYCSDECKQKCPLYGFNPNYDFIKNKENNPLYTQAEYYIFRNEVLKRQFEKYNKNFCEMCESESIKSLHIHHEKTQKTHHMMVLDPDNGIVLCQECHLKKIHIGECSATGIFKNCKEKNGSKSTSVI